MRSGYMFGSRCKIMKQYFFNFDYHSGKWKFRYYALFSKNLSPTGEVWYNLMRHKCVVFDECFLHAFLYPLAREGDNFPCQLLSAGGISYDYIYRRGATGVAKHKFVKMWAFFTFWVSVNIFNLEQPGNEVHKNWQNLTFAKKRK